MLVFGSIAGTVVEASNLIGQVTPLVLLNGRQYGSAFTAAQLHALAAAPLQVQTFGYDVQQVLFAVYLFAASYLIARSSFFPRFVAVLLAMAGLSYLVFSFADVLAPNFAARLVPWIQIPSGIGELAFCLCLLVVGVNSRRWVEQARALA